MKFLTRDRVKKTARWVVARSVQATVTLVVHNNADPETRYQKAQVHIAAYALGEMAGKASEPYVDAKVDKYAESLAKAKALVAEVEAEKAAQTKE